MSDNSESPELRQLEELWTRFLARAPLSAEERAQLVQAIEGDEGLRRRLLDDLRLDGALRALGEIERGQEPLVAKVKALVTAAGRTEEVVAAVRRRIEAKAVARRGGARAAPARRGWSGIALVAGVVLVAAAAVIWLRPRMDANPGPVAQVSDDPSGATPAHPALGRWERARPSAPSEAGRAAANPPRRTVLAKLASSEGAVYRHGADGTVRAGATLELGPGDWISTSGTTTRARLEGPGGSQIELTGDVVAGVSAELEEGVAEPRLRLFVAHGRINATLPAGPGTAGTASSKLSTSLALSLASPHAIVTGAGSVRLDVGTTMTRVEVKAGHARVSALGVQRGTDVESGQMALVSGDDLQAPRAQAAREALLLTGPDDTKEEQPTGGGLRASEERMKARLERLGFQVAVIEAVALSPERARTAKIIVLSSSVASNLLEPWLGELPVPLLVLESTGFEQLGLTGSRWLRDVGPTPPLTEITIENAAHPLAAGLAGTVRVLTLPVKLRWAATPPGATPIATYAGGSDQAALLFGYERGANTMTGPAPARRVGMFLGNGRVIRVLTEQGWRLFDAAVLWAAGG
jgi:hypothetical protein